MKKKSIIILLGLLVIFVYGIWVQKNHKQKDEEEIIIDKHLVTFNSPSDVDSISVISKDQKVEIIKNGQEWKTDTGYSVYSVDVELLLEQVIESRINSVVSFDTDDNKKWRLSPDEAFEYIFRRGDEVIGHFTIGQGDFSDGYILRNGDDKIVSLLNPDYIFFNYEWRDRIIQNIDVQSVIEVIIKQDSQTITLSRVLKEDAHVWIINKEDANQEAIENYVNGLRSITASNFPNPDLEFISSDKTVKIKTARESYVITIGQVFDENQTVVKNDRGLLFLVNTQKTVPKLVAKEKDLR